MLFPQPYVGAYPLIPPPSPTSFNINVTALVTLFLPNIIMALLLVLLCDILVLIATVQVFRCVRKARREGDRDAEVDLEEGVELEGLKVEGVGGEGDGGK
ncbi:uncharacterized protein BDZ99DRAFT_524521 [Mytilinidion resinicola]|uniref:Uncharacterized protein n=1 Tax=Mytilinidion resinicola TaxID=574789 RepID=A0A6A6Y9P9_9PEZI|nr:uncharacterized protein BDZ99DRAFT_524521 [Mytilinidion resinicola]KAF2805552.1 hypothetical protein BDZ99DRAFT_524521 [Mytilinidion resinicola]